MKNVADKYAIVVGVSSYEDDGIPNLHYTTNDAVRLAHVLSQKSGYHPNRIYLLTDIEKTELQVNLRKPTRSNILDVIEFVAKNASDESDILFFFAGHGAEISKAPYLITSDTKLNVVNKTAIDIQDINSTLQESKAKCVIRVFDACRSSGFGDGRSILGRMTDGLQDAISYKAKGWATLSSCSSGQVAYETSDFEHGVFSNYLCEALEGKAALDDGIVTFDRLVDYVKIGVQSWCDRRTLQQTPHLASDLAGTLVLSQVELEATVSALPPENPLSSFLVRLDSRISHAPADVRNMTFTNADQLKEFSKHLIEATDSITNGFSHNVLTIVNVPVPNATDLFVNARSSIQKAFTADLNDLKIREEFREITAIRYTFASSDVIVPTTDLYIAAVRFSFFYLVWWIHICNSKQLENRFNPNPPHKKGLKTFKPEAALNRDKVTRVVTEIYAQASLTMLEWSEQLGEFVNTRIDPLRKLGDVIE